MYEFVRIGENSGYINCPAKIGVYLRNNSEAYLIDSGNDKDAGKKAKRQLEANGLQLMGIINTHSHADHIGGNGYLQKQTGCSVFSTGIEKAFTEYPILEASYIYGGFPPKQLRHKFLLAEESRCADFSSVDFPSELELVPLPGHSFNMVGVMTPDRTFFAADSVSSEATLEKYRISFLCDVGEYLNTLDTLEKIDAKVFVPSHAEVAESIHALCEVNRSCVLEIGNRICSICSEKKCFDSVLKSVFDEYSLAMSFEQYALVGSTVRSYLSWLLNEGRMEAVIEDNMLLWHSL